MNNGFLKCEAISEHDLAELDSFFRIDRPEGKNLEIYIRSYAYEDELANEARTYIVRDSGTNEIAGYFSLKAMSVSINDTILNHDTQPGIELSNFAVNDNYKRHCQIKHLGVFIFNDFILPLAHDAANIIGIKYLCIFALPYKNLMAFYNKIGFTRLIKKQERRLHRRIKPRYDKKCIFMYQII